MRKTAAILFTVVLALLVMPLQLPAASCILSKAPNREACQSKCCANMICCAVSEKNNAPASHPLYKSDVSKQVIGFISVPVFASHVFAGVAEPVAVTAPMRAHSPPPLAATCIRLI
ncbi:MAG: hypothetical protein DME97_05115 [Verrucomicrobia bacterium]|nr:MAG: hypothetical protein DME97_05115 [Verrucomicrobiota bacterium]